jgi:hypothetical protein
MTIILNKIATESNTSNQEGPFKEAKRVAAKDMTSYKVCHANLETCSLEPVKKQKKNNNKSSCLSCPQYHHLVVLKETA